MNNAVSINAVVEPEGWAIFNDYEIQKDDEMEVFLSDEDAVSHVERLAQAGSAVHAAALAIHRRHAMNNN